MVSILTAKIGKVKGDHHLINMDVNDSNMEIHSWVSWFSTLSFQQNIRLNIMSFVIYCQNDRKRICNQVFIHLFGLLLLLIFSLGLVMCLLPPKNIADEEMAVVKSILDSPGNFWNSNICPIHRFYWMLFLYAYFHIKVDIRVKVVVRLPNILTQMVFFLWVLIMMKNIKI